MLAGDHDGGGTIGDAGGVPGSDGSAFREDRLESGQLFQRSPMERVLVSGDDLRAFFTCDGDLSYFLLEISLGDGCCGALLGREGELVLFVTGNFVLFGHRLGYFPHVNHILLAVTPLSQHTLVNTLPA